MAHVDPEFFAALASQATVRARDLGHVDRCVACRQAAAQRGIPAERFALPDRAGRWRRSAAAVAFAAIVATAAVAYPLRGTATGFLAAFEPRRVAALPLTLNELQSLGNIPDFSAYAATRELRAPTSANFDDVRAAMAAAGFGIRQPAAVGGIRVAGFQVNGPTAQVLTFGEHPAGNRTPARALPPDIAGSTLRIDIGATVIANYVTTATAADEQRLRAAMQRGMSVSRNGNVTTYRVGSPTTTIVRHGQTHQMYRPANPGGIVAGNGNMLPLVVVQMPVPRIATTGVSMARLASFMLSQPGVSPRVAAAFGALGDLSTTLPIPVPIDKAYTQPVLVDGVQGVGLGDDTGIGAAVIWQKNGMLYAVFATQTARNVLAIANTLQ